MPCQNVKKSRYNTIIYKKTYIEIISANANEGVLRQCCAVRGARRQGLPTERRRRSASAPAPKKEILIR